MDLDKTVCFSSNNDPVSGRQITIFDADKAPYTIELSAFQKNVITFGRANDNDVVLSSKLVTHDHGRFAYTDGKWYIEDRAVVKNKPSTNGLFYNNSNISRKQLYDGDFIRIDDGIETISEGVLFVISSAQTQNKWHTISLRSGVTIGRNHDCDITLPHISVSQHHARITKEGSDYYINDLGSTK